MKSGADAKAFMRCLSLGLLLTVYADGARAEDEERRLGTDPDKIAADYADREKLELYQRLSENTAPIGVVEKIFHRSRVTRMGADGQKRATAALATPLYQNDRLVTEETSKLYARFIDKTHVELAPSTAFGIERVRRGADRESDRKDETIFRFYYGLARITAVSVEPYVRYYIKNNERVITLEGPSDIYLEVNGKNGDLRIHVWKGSVTFLSSVRGVKAIIPEGQSREVRRDNTLKELQSPSRAEWQKIKSKTMIRMN